MLPQKRLMFLKKKIDPFRGENMIHLSQSSSVMFPSHVSSVNYFILSLCDQTYQEPKAEMKLTYPGYTTVEKYLQTNGVSRIRIRRSEENFSLA